MRKTGTFHFAFVLAAAGLLLLMTAGEAWALPDYKHTNKITNRTGRIANDLHIEVPTAPTKNPTAPPFTTAKKNIRSIDFTGGVVGNGGSANVTWYSKQKRDTISSSYWTFDGRNIGAARVSYLVPDFQDLGGGQYAVLIDNQNPNPIPYSGLLISTAIDPVFLDDYLNHMHEGIPMTPPTGLSGVLNPGMNQVAVINVIPDGYTAGSIQLADFGSDVVPLGMAGFTGPPDPCAQLGHMGDFNCDGTVGLLDLDILGQNWGFAGVNPDVSHSFGDANGDGNIGLLDLDILGQNWGITTVPIPEPASLAMVMGSLAVILSRRR